MPLTEISALVITKFIEEFELYYLRSNDEAISILLSGINASDVLHVIDGHLYPPPYPLDCIYVELVAIKHFMEVGN